MDTSSQPLPPKARIAFINRPTITRIVPELAMVVGLNESILLLQLDYWIGTVPDANFKDGKWWTYQSLSDMQEKAFPYWSIATLSRTVKSLKEKELIFVGNYNTRKGDKTQWFALNAEKLAKIFEGIDCLHIVNTPTILQNETPILHFETPKLQNETTLPESTTESTTDIEKTSGAENSDDVPATPQKERNPIFDIVALESFGIDATISKVTEGARVGKIVSWLTTNSAGATAETLKAFYRWYDKETKGANRPRDVIKFGEHFTKFKQAQTAKARTADQKIIDFGLKPVSDDEFEPFSVDAFVSKTVTQEGDNAA